MKEQLLIMIDKIADDDFKSARETLKATLAAYLSGKKYLSNKDIYGDEYSDPSQIKSIDDQCEVQK